MSMSQQPARKCLQNEGERKREPVFATSVRSACVPVVIMRLGVVRGVENARAPQTREAASDERFTLVAMFCSQAPLILPLRHSSALYVPERRPRSYVLRRYPGLRL